MSRRVVVTGLGSVTPLGRCMESTWKSLLIGRKACSDVVTDTGYEVFRIPDSYLSIPTDHRRTSRFIQLALQAGQEALTSAGLLSAAVATTEEDDEVYVDRGVSVGCGLSCVEEISNAATGSLRRLSPYFVPKVLLNSAAGRLSMQHRYGGPNLSATTACAAGAHAIIDAYHCIQRGDATVMLAGGTESCLDSVSIAGFHRLKALSKENISRPFDTNRDGFIMSEGASILVLEDYQHALDRNCTTILGEIIGYGLTADAHHMTQPSGDGAKRCMSMALSTAAAKTSTTNSVHVDYINAHATSTPVGDVMEVEAIQSLFQHPSSKNSNHNNPLYVSSTKGATGHLLGAAGALEASLCLLALRDQVIPPTHNLQQPIPQIQNNPNDHIVYPSQDPISTNIRIALSNSFGFGGTNACLIFQKIPEE